MKNDFKNIPMRAKEGEITCDVGGCDFRVIPGSKYCALHHRPDGDLYKLKKAEITHRISEIRKHPDSQNLEVELAFVRSLLENLINQCEDSLDLIRNAPQISVLVDKIEKLLASNIKAGQISGQLLSIEEVVTIAQAIVAIVTEYLEPDDIEEVVERIGRVLTNE